tara:strand:+ start:427 stop:822 length:396 start_codon:yes stop_codon:yes gene_type:complete
MTDKSTLLKTFNTQFFAFLNDILVIFPENKDIAKGKKSLELLNMATPSMIIKIWHSHVNKLYKEHIDNGDLDYFIEKDYSADIKTLSDSDDVLKIINMIRDPVRQMDETNRSHTRKYLQILSKLSMLYNEA